MPHGINNELVNEQHLKETDVEIITKLEQFQRRMDQSQLLDDESSESSFLLRGSRTSRTSQVMFFIKTNTAFRHSSQVSTGIFLACCLSYFEGFQYIREWAAITLLVTFENTYGGFLRKGIQRTIGTVIGGAIGLLILAVAFALPPACFQCSYKPLFLAICIFITSFYLTFLKLKSNNTYGYICAILTILIVVLGYF